MNVILKHSLQVQQKRKTDNMVKGNETDKKLSTSKEFLLWKGKYCLYSHNSFLVITENQLNLQILQRKIQTDY